MSKHMKSETPLTEAVYDDWLNGESLLRVDEDGNEVVDYRALAEKMIFHAKQMERDRAILLLAVRAALRADEALVAKITEALGETQ
jgi:hypothetical protein